MRNIYDLRGVEDLGGDVVGRPEHVVQPLRPVVHLK